MPSLEAAKPLTLPEDNPLVFCEPGVDSSKDGTYFETRQSHRNCPCTSLPWTEDAASTSVRLPTSVVRPIKVPKTFITLELKPSSRNRSLLQKPGVIVVMITGDADDTGDAAASEREAKSSTSFDTLYLHYLVSFSDFDSRNTGLE